MKITVKTTVALLHIRC